MSKKEQADAAEKKPQEAQTDQAEEAAPKKPKKQKEQQPGNEAPQLDERLQTLQKQLDDQKDQMLRIAAEYDNFRRRSQREKEAAYLDAKADTLHEILPVLDNFERAAGNAEAELADYKKGVEMIFQQLTDIVAKLGVEAFGAEGDPFDPNMHNAVMHVEEEALGENVVAQVFAKGYKLGDRIIRHAVVKVAN